MKDQPFLSLCLIVKDEINLIDKCLDSIEHLVDEVIIVDTGSSDGTWERAQCRATVAIQTQWNGFADARNIAQDAARGQWIVVLDADETIADTTGWDSALEAAASGEYDAIAFVLFNELPDNQILANDRTWQIRMFRNAPEIRWIGKVHNQIAQSIIENSIGDEPKFFQAQIMINHVGYNLGQGIMKKKYKKRMGLLQEELDGAKDDKTRSYYQYQNANALFMQNEYDKAFIHIQGCDFDHMTIENAYSTALMAVHCTHILGIPKEGLEYAKKMLDMNAGEAMSFLMMGLCYMEAEKWKEAYNFLGASLAMCQLKDMDYKYKLDQNYIAAPAGEAALNLKRLEEAKALFQMHLAKYDTKKIRELEAAIVPVEEAQAQGYLPVDGQKTPVVVPQASPAETVLIQDARRVDSPELSE